jgi:hypothetical protein
VVERSERYASVAKPEEPKDINDERVPRLLGEVFNAYLNFHAPNAQRARRGHGMLQNH